jgi:hypothetical protein
MCVSRQSRPGLRLCACWMDVAELHCAVCCGKETRAMKLETWGGKRCFCYLNLCLKSAAASWVHCFSVSLPRGYEFNCVSTVGAVTVVASSCPALFCHLIRLFFLNCCRLDTEISTLVTVHYFFVKAGCCKHSIPFQVMYQAGSSLIIGIWRSIL